MAAQTASAHPAQTQTGAASGVNLTVGVDEKLPLIQTVLMGLQHVLAMDVYVPPFLIATALALTPDASAGLIQSTFLGAGVATLIQVLLCLRIPVCQGPSFVPIGAMVGLYLGSGGFDTVFGACLAGALFVVLLGASGLYSRAVRHFVPSIVSGTVIIVVGISLMHTAFSDSIFPTASSLSMGQNAILASVSACVMIACSMLGVYKPRVGKLLRIGSVILALLVGCVVAAFMGVLDLSGVAETAWLSLPHIAFVNYGLAFNPFAILTMCVIYVVLLAESTGCWYAISSVIDRPMTDKQVNRGVVGEGLGCLVGSFIGAIPVTGYSTNVGIVSITGVASKHVFAAAALWFVAFSFMGKLSALIMAVPSAVIGGVFAVVCSIIMLNGFKQIKSEPFDERQLFIVGIPVVMAIAMIHLPAELTNAAPQFIQYLLGSPIAVGAFVCVALNKLLPEREQAHQE